MADDTQPERGLVLLNEWHVGLMVQSAMSPDEAVRCARGSKSRSCLGELLSARSWVQASTWTSTADDVALERFQECP